MTTPREQMIIKVLDQIQQTTFTHPDAGPGVYAAELVDALFGYLPWGHPLVAAADQAAARDSGLDAFEQYARPSPSDKPGARMWLLPNGWAVSLVPDTYEPDPVRAAAAGRWELLVGVLLGGRFFKAVYGGDNPFGWDDVRRTTGYDDAGEALTALMAAPAPKRYGDHDGEATP